MGQNVHQSDTARPAALPQGGISNSFECSPHGRSLTEQALNRELVQERSARRQVECLLAEKEELLAHNEMLLREIDHRVKNSLQLVASALSLQARCAANDSTRQALKEACDRIAAVAAIHQQLSRPSTSGQIDLSEFLVTLCGALTANKPNNIDSVILSSTPVAVRSEIAMKVGVLVAELVINTFKHAYEPEGRGDVRVKLEYLDHACRIVVEDDGVRIPKGYEDNDQRGFGLRLVRSIVGQLGGTLSYAFIQGTQFTVHIPEISN